MAYTTLKHAFGHVQRSLKSLFVIRTPSVPLFQRPSLRLTHY